MPDERHFLFNRISKAAADTGLYVGSVESTEVQRVAPIAERVLYASGHLVYTRGDTVYAQPFDVSTRRVTGEPVAVASPAGLNRAYASLAVSQNGTLSFGGVNQAVASRLLLIDRQGRVVREVVKDAVIADVRASRDGRHVAFVTMRDMVNGSISTIELARGLPVRLSTDPSRSDRLPVWSSDSTILQFTSAILPGAPSFEVRRRRLDRPDAEELITALPPPSFVTDWSRDGEHIVYQHGLPWDLHRFAVSSKQSEPLVVGPFNESEGQIAPNGRVLAFVSDESGREEVYVQPFQAAGRRQRVTVQGGREPKWRDDSGELFYRAADGALMAVSIAERDGELVPGPPVRLAADLAWALRGGSGLHRTFDALPGGQQFVVNTFPPNVAGPEITVIVNWPELLRR